MTDDSSIAEWAGLTVVVVAGAPDNRKLTTADLSDAEVAPERRDHAGDRRYPGRPGLRRPWLRAGRRRRAVRPFPTSSAFPVIPMPMRRSMP